MAKGSIPACAGEPTLQSQCSCDGGVYPRVCGGTPGQAVSRSPPAGLSPRVRGNPVLAHVVSRASGSIPACAGEPSRVSLAGTSDGVYPRVCGGTFSCCSCASVCVGLSPRVRGTCACCPCACSRQGLSPRVRGNRRRFRFLVAFARVYPRVCGGTFISAAIAASSVGLSPRVRGNRRRFRCLVVLHGSIPACAGEPR